MKLHRAALLISLAVALGCAGCQTAKQKPDPQSGAANSPGKPANLKTHTRNNCASLLHDLLNDEKHLNKLLLIKRESDELDALVKDISNTARRAAKKLDEMAAADSALHLKTMALPAGEIAARKAIAESKERELLRAKGKELQFKLLLTQAEALNYGAHLARVAAEHEPRSDHAREFSVVSAELENLYRRVIALLQSAPALKS